MKLSASEKAARLCSLLSLPRFIVDQAAVHAQKIFRAPYKVTLEEAAVAGVICAYKESGTHTS